MFEWLCENIRDLILSIYMLDFNFFVYNAILEVMKSCVNVLFFSFHASYGVMSFKPFVGHLFDKQTTQSTASARNSFNIFLVLSILLTMLRLLMFFLSTMPFCYSDLHKKSLNSLELNSPPICLK
jgi:hypothetical protein